MRWKTWLRHCDQHHKCVSRPTYDDFGKQWPSRLLNVTPSSDLNEIRLEDTKDITKGQRYAALSHCWGQASKDKSRSWRTLGGNVAERRHGFTLSSLPLTLRDAVSVTRDLGMQYLWIDSLCVIQDGDDWEKESKRMEAIFASAYCTIAATAASDSESGFLNKMTNSTSAQHGSCSDLKTLSVPTDFDNNINKAPLNQRAWVMQERLLSSRTIHFGKDRVYGECGHGVYTGDDVMLRSPPGSKKYYELDAQFPNRLRTSGLNNTMKFLYHWIENYSGRGITMDIDRPAAISGLMSRIAKVLSSEIHHGIIKWFLQRTLLWRRVNNQVTPKIDYREKSIPSWSWMAYSGSISFIYDDYDWGGMAVIRDIGFGQDALEAAVWRFSDPHITIRSDGASNNTDGTQLLDLEGSTKGWISLDTEVNLLKIPNVVVLGWSTKSQKDVDRCFVLFVKPQKSGNYERLGVGRIQKDCELVLIGRHHIV